ncbi:hypothetical protein [Treponema brennaborense]|uniref:Uncharacterized protein n=1 Tax=Treponema brennaborense (strain DSM 12168 / CIP 105900 / DD5/3) TaxID=906968 RepID=F4LQF0_TREBD|nr:hypothetical protein [Treponema brennaborense]AEE17159.1 hypothetical protein Trebr_1737 [Treponema brennaborense DSM 12168]
MAFLNKMKDYLDKGVEVSKDAFSKAGEAVQDFGDKSVLRIEIKQLEGKLNREYESLGEHVYGFFETNAAESLSADDSEISGILAEIKRLRAEMEKREDSLAGTRSDSDSEAFSESSTATTAMQKGKK